MTTRAISNWHNINHPQTKLRGGNSTPRGCFLILLLALVCGADTRAHAASPPNGVAPLLIPAGGFALEGNLLANTPTSGVGDWIALPSIPGPGGGVLAANGTPLNAATTFHLVDPYTTNTDTIITGGNANLNPNAWTWGTGTVLNKEDLNNGLVHVGRDASNQVWVVVSADHTGTGDADMYFYFLQNTLTKNANRTFTSAGPHAGFTLRDLRLKLNFSGSSFLADQWQTNTSGVQCGGSEGEERKQSQSPGQPARCRRTRQARSKPRPRLERSAAFTPLQRTMARERRIQTESAFQFGC